MHRVPRVAVAYSGGRDSTALLHATLCGAAAVGVRVNALHVHHGLSEHADAWLEHCQKQCERWRQRGWPIDFSFDRLLHRPADGESVEAWAREQRYLALGAMARACGVSLVLLAQHRRDQAETWLLQALRGAGMAGLSGMPDSAVRDGITWVRPWLHQSRDAIEAYLRRHRLRFVDDDSNSDSRFARNRLRIQVWPSLQAAFPHAEATLAMSAQWAQEASSCLEELAALDLGRVASEQGLDVTAWLRLSAPRRTNALRAWLMLHRGQGGAGANLTARLLTELPSKRSARWPCAEGVLRLYRGSLSFEAASSEVAQVSREQQLSVLRGGDYELPGWAGRLRVRRCQQGGVPLAWLAGMELRQRSGGEQFQSGIGRPPRSLKKQFQAAAMPSWLRAGPLFYSGGQLVFVPGLGIDARVLALPGQTQVSLEWHPLPQI